LAPGEQGSVANQWQVSMRFSVVSASCAYRSTVQEPKPAQPVGLDSSIQE
jgi:hypothetical protein